MRDGTRAVTLALSFWCAAAAAAAGAAAADGEGRDPRQRDRREQGKPLPPEESAAAMTLPPGFTATLFAAEPDVRQPIGFCLDHRGRLWVAENDSYPTWRADGRDRVVILEDADGDGRCDRRTVFADRLHYVTGVLVGTGGVWVMDCPNLLFFPVDEGGDKPAGEPVVHLDGWSAEGVHNLPNSLTWGPDGWLYGCNGTIFDVAIGPPGAPPERRTKMNRGVWRYHPAKRTFERFAEGTANPWGLDYDARGQMFMTNNVVAHLWHVVQGGHYPRVAHGSDSDPHAYEMLPTIADHRHWGEGDWTESRGGRGEHSAAGGGHSHAGCMVYGGESFPAGYRGTVFMCNTHGHRLNNDALERKGSGFVARHRPDFLLANDEWFKGVAAHYGPDGAVYVIDWSDAGECHDADVTDRAHGRIYRVAHEGTERADPDLGRTLNSKLVEMQTWPNEWYARHARVVLRDRGLADDDKAALAGMLETAKDPVHRLRAMWTLHACGAAGEGRLLDALSDRDEYVRAWAIQLLAEGNAPPAAALERFAAMAADGDESPVVRLYLAAAMRRTPVGLRRPVLEALAAHGEDAGDPNLPQMYWYALEPVVAADRGGAVALLAKVKIPKLREWVARRIAAAD